MLVALVSPYDWAVPGGVQSQVSGLARALVRNGCEVVVAAPGPRGGGEGSPREVSTGYDVVSLGRSLKIPVNGSVAPVAPTPAAAARCLLLLRRRRPDVVHLHEPMAPGPALAALMAGPRPIVATLHRAGSDRLYRFEGQLFGRFTDRIAVMAAVSESARATAAEVLGSRADDIVIVPNGIEGRSNGEAPSTGDAASSTGDLAPSTGGSAPAAAPRRPTVAFVGRHEERKGLGVLLEALSSIESDVDLVVVGDGPQSAALRRQYASDPRVHWAGAVDDEGRADVLSTAQLFVAPSLGGESFGVVLLEAMAAGVPVVASDLAGYRVAAGDDGAVHFVPPGDAGALARAIVSLLSDPPARARLRERGRQRAEQFSMDAIARRYIELYASAAASR